MIGSGLAQIAADWARNSVTLQETYFLVDNFAGHVNVVYKYPASPWQNKKVPSPPHGLALLSTTTDNSW